MDRSTPFLTRLSALLALLIAALAAGPIDSASAGRPTVAARGLLAELAAPLPGKQLATRAAAREDEGKGGGGAPAILPSSSSLNPSAVGAALFQAAAAPYAQGRAASYRARAPPAA